MFLSHFLIIFDLRDVRRKDGERSRDLSLELERSREKPLGGLL